MSLASIYLSILSRLSWYDTGEGFLARLHPISKLVLMLAGVVIAVIAKAGMLLAGFAILFLLAMASAGVRRIPYLYLSLVFFIAPMIIFSTLYMYIWTRSINAVTYLLISIAISSTRLMVMSTAFYLFFATTRVQSIVRILNRLGIPYKYGYGIALAITLLPVIANDLVEILSVQKTRGLFLGNSIFEKIRRLIAVSIPLIITTLNRVDDIVISLEVRGFGFSDKRSYLYREPFEIRDAMFIAFCVAWLTLSIVLGI